MLVSIMERGQAEKHKSSINTKISCIWNKDSFPWSTKILAYFPFGKSTPIPKFNVLPTLWYKTESTVAEHSSLNESKSPCIMSQCNGSQYVQTLGCLSDEKTF